MDKTDKKGAEKMNRMDMSVTVPVRISKYLRDRLLKESKEKQKCIPRLLLEILDPAVAKEFPNHPRNRGDKHASPWA